MKWVIELLNNRLRQMNDAYEKYVLNGNVNTDSLNAVENRKKAKQLSNAIKILSATVNTSDGQLIIPDISNRYMADCLIQDSCLRFKQKGCNKDCKLYM